MTEKLVEGRPIEPRDLIAPEDFKPCWKEELTEDAYHEDRTTIGSTMLRQALISPNAFHHAMFVEKEPEEKEAFKYGKLIHMAILEPEKFRERFVVEPEFWGKTAKGELTNSKNCKEVKEKAANWRLDLPPGAIILTEKEHYEITIMLQSALRHDDIPHLLKNGKPEVAGYFRDKETGLRLKIKPDFLSFDVSRMTDVKSTKDLNKRKFASSSDSYRYDVQLYMYAEGVKAITGKFPDVISTVALGKTKPFEAAAFHLPVERLEQGAKDYRLALTRIKAGIDSGKWPMGQQRMESLPTSYWFISETVERESDNA